MEKTFFSRCLFNAKCHLLDAQGIMNNRKSSYPHSIQGVGSNQALASNEVQLEKVVTFNHEWTGLDLFH